MKQLFIFGLLSSFTFSIKAMDVSRTPAAETHALSLSSMVLCDNDVSGQLAVSKIMAKIAFHYKFAGGVARDKFVLRGASADEYQVSVAGPFELSTPVFYTEKKGVTACITVTTQK